MERVYKVIGNGWIGNWYAFLADDDPQLYWSPPFNEVGRRSEPTTRNDVMGNRHVHK